MASGLMMPYTGDQDDAILTEGNIETAPMDFSDLGYGAFRATDQTLFAAMRPFLGNPYLSEASMRAKSIFGGSGAMNAASSMGYGWGMQNPYEIVQPTFGFMPRGEAL